MRLEWLAVEGGSRQSWTFIHIEEALSYFPVTPPPHTPHLKGTSCFLRLSILPCLSTSHTPPLSHVWKSSGPRFSLAFTLLGDGPVAVALVVRWSAASHAQGRRRERGREGRVMQTGTDSGQHAKGGGRDPPLVALRSMRPRDPSANVWAG